MLSAFRQFRAVYIPIKVIQGRSMMFEIILSNRPIDRF